MFHYECGYLNFILILFTNFTYKEDFFLSLSNQRVKRESVESISYFPDPNLFYVNYVQNCKPVVLKGVLNQLQKEFSYNRWTDKYLLENYGDIIVEVERGKKEDRSGSMRYMTLREFISVYQFHDLYLVDTVPRQLEDEVLVYSPLSCGGFENKITDAVMWFSSGGTKSTLHMDAVDNINCILDGDKDVILFDKIYNDAIISHGFNISGGYSHVDVEHVDPTTFPVFRYLPQRHVHLSQGDCLYLPFKMFHQVDTAHGRSLAVNLWFVHMWWFNETSCSSSAEHSHQPLSHVHYTLANEQFRCVFLEPFSHLANVSLKDFYSIIKSSSYDKIFNDLDSDKDGVLTWQEMYSFNVDNLLLSYPNLTAAV